MTYYDLLAEGFRQGHLYIPAAPSSELLAQANPYDPKHSRLWFWDMTLYGTHYYLYWGPVPALLQAAVKSALSIHGMVGDQYLVFTAFSLSAVFGGLLIERMARRLFDTVPRWLRAVMVLAFALANPAPHLLASGGVYQGSIGFGQAFALGGLVLAFDVVCAAPLRGFDWRLPAAGTLWALAFGSRLSMLPSTTLLAFLTASTCAWATPMSLRSFVKYASWLAAPMVVGLGLLLVYNKLRFDNWLDMGVNNQLSGFKFSFSKIYLLTNLYSYSLRPYVPDCHFPYAMAPWWLGTRAFPDEMEVPAGYLINEPVVGWLRVVPITWLLVAVPAGVVQRFRLLRRRTASRNGSQPALDTKPRAFLWCAACFCVLSSVNGAAVLGLYMSTMRYLADVTNGLVLLGVLGSFVICSWPSRRVSRRAVALACSVPALVTVVFGLLLGYQGYTGHFKTYNPKLNEKLVEILSVCDDAEH
ncbi:MAG: hypothetical protein WDO69_08395 [Pseudomonadota bacterium]